MKYQFTNHDYIILIPEELEIEFRQDPDKLKLLSVFLKNAGLPHFKNVAEDASLIPILSSGMVISQTHTIGVFDLCILDMMGRGMFEMNMLNMMIMTLVKLKEAELDRKRNGPEPEEKPFKSSLLL